MTLSDDATALDALDMVYRQGKTQLDVRKKYGLSKGAVSGFFNRDRDSRDPARIGEGTMPRYWYRAGLEART